MESPEKNGEGGLIRGRGEHAIEGPVYYRINDDNTGPELLIEVCIERGWRSWDSKDNAISGDDNQYWQLWWRHSFPGIVYRRLKQNQILNHISRANGLCRKDILARTLHKMQNAYPQAFDFSPATFILPGEYTKLVAEYTRILYHTKYAKNNNLAVQDDQNVSSSPRSTSESSDHASLNIWICKPTGSSQGKGISIFQDLHDLSYGGSAVVQRYLEHPLLIGGYKCDVRLYVLVVSFVPLSIYIYSEGVVRFGTDKYNLDVLDNPFSHLTNTSINKTSPGYKLEKNRVGTGCKWTLRQLRRHFKSNGQRDWLLWQRVNVLISLTLLSQISRLAYNNHSPYTNSTETPRHGTCFELYGFDILVDEDLTPWLLEVNRCPSLTYDCDVDRVVKKPLLHHLFDLVGPPKATQPIERPLKVVNGNEGPPSSVSRAKEGNWAHHVDRNSYRRRRSSVCEDCDDYMSKMNAEDHGSALNLSHKENSPALMRWRNGLKTSRTVQTTLKGSHLLNALSRSEGNVSKKASCHSFGGRGSFPPRRRNSVSSLKEKLSTRGSRVAEETSEDTYVPFNHNSTFHRLRKQFISDHSTSGRYYVPGPNWGSLSSLESVSKPFALRQDGRPQHKNPPRCGDWIRTFPYNAATLHGSRNPIFAKNVVAELLKYRRTCEKVFKESPSGSQEELNSRVRKLLWGDHVLWSPKDG